MPVCVGGVYADLVAKGKVCVFACELAGRDCISVPLCS